MADDFLSSLGQGLRGAGAILSSPVYEQQNREQMMALAEMQRRRAELARALVSGIESGAVDPNNEQVKMTLQRLGVPATAFGPSPQARSAAEGLRADSALRARLPKAGMTASSDELLKTLTSGGLEDLTGPMGGKLLGIASTMQNRESIQQKKQRDYELRVDALTQRAEEREREAVRREASDADRAEARREANAIKLQIAQMADAARREGLSLRREAAGTRADAQREKDTAKLEKETAPVADLVNEIDRAIRMIDENPGVSGARGMLTRGKEFLQSTVSPGTPTPGSDFQSQIIDIQSRWRKLPTIAANRFKSDASKIDSEIKGLGTFTSDTMARNSLMRLRDSLSSGLQRRGMGEATDGTKQPPKISSDADYEALPSGTEFIDPEGKRRRKP